MCYELDEFYWRDRAEEARKAMEKAKDSKKPAETAAPAKPEKTETKVPVPA